MLGKWVKEPESLLSVPSDPLVAWLTQAYILSQALKGYCQDLSVNVLNQSFHQGLDDEYALLGVKCDQSLLIRRIFLQGDGIPWTYSRVVIPPKTYLNYAAQFETLGTKLLGETLLYHREEVSRSAFEYTMLKPMHLLFKEIDVALPRHLAKFLDKRLYGRRSIFYIKENPLLISDFLLTGMPEAPYSRALKKDN